MGWLFGWSNRKDLVKHLTKGNGLKTLKSCSVGTNLWAVHELEDGRKFICLYLIKGPPYGRENDRYGWGYKDVDETMGPCQTNCPASYLDLAQPEPTEGYAVEWRKLVRARAAKLKAAVPGARFISADERVWRIDKRRSPSSWYVINETEGGRYRAGSKVVSSWELIQ